ncbi:uncharacterized protein [Triticum aestivum]|uniref:uncharacterized protein n=1 Tax=Triticum aestivum TaxID=4565 RepID=UPI001D02EBB4|nr:uncharacterized protein LOC123102529 [Triticum aestivum]
MPPPTQLTSTMLQHHHTISCQWGSAAESRHIGAPPSASFCLPSVTLLHHHSARFQRGLHMPLRQSKSRCPGRPPPSSSLLHPHIGLQLGPLGAASGRARCPAVVLTGDGRAGIHRKIEALVCFDRDAFLLMTLEPPLRTSTWWKFVSVRTFHKVLLVVVVSRALCRRQGCMCAVLSPTPWHQGGRVRRDQQSMAVGFNFIPPSCQCGRWG